MLPPEPTDALATLRRIEERAQDARRAFERHNAINGRHALRQIEEEAGDALVRAAERGERDGAGDA